MQYARKGQRGGWVNHSLGQECCQTSYQLIERLAMVGAWVMFGRELWIWWKPPTQANRLTDRQTNLALEAPRRSFEMKKWSYLSPEVKNEKNKDSLFSSTLKVGENWKKHFFLQAQADLHVYYFLLLLLRFPNLHFLILKILYVPKFDAE